MSERPKNPLDWRMQIQLPPGRAALPIDLGAELPLEHVALRVPQLDDSDHDEERGLLHWRTQTSADIRRAEWILDEFILLADDSADRLRGMASRWGPLENCGELPNRAAVAGGDWVEPEATWRDQARLLRSVLTVAAGLVDSQTPDPKIWAEALLRLNLIAPSAKGLDLEASIEDWASYLVIANAGLTREAAGAMVREMAGAVLHESDIRPDAGIGVEKGTGPFVTMIGSVADQVSSRLQGGDFVVQGLRSILSIQAVAAIRNQRIYPCWGCGKIIPIANDADRPRTGIPFYGNHEECRLAARRASKREVARRYRLKKVAQG